MNLKEHLGIKIKSRGLQKNSRNFQQRNKEISKKSLKLFSNHNCSLDITDKVKFQIEWQIIPVQSQSLRPKTLVVW